MGGPVELLLLDEDLRQDIANGEAGEGRERLHQQRLLLQQSLVVLPDRDKRVDVVPLVAITGRRDAAAGAAASATASNAAARAARRAVLDADSAPDIQDGGAERPASAAQQHLWRRRARGDGHWARRPQQGRLHQGGALPAERRQDQSTHEHPEEGEPVGTASAAAVDDLMS